MKYRTKDRQLFDARFDDERERGWKAGFDDATNGRLYGGTGASGLEGTSDVYANAYAAGSRRGLADTPKHANRAGMTEGPSARYAAAMTLAGFVGDALRYGRLEMVSDAYRARLVELLSEAGVDVEGRS